ncbi:MAG: FAD-binding oxidoreductase [Fibrobacter sp.]|nr:FAD-binding oxidoreductase [Fibrobacter sp.]
MLIIDGQNIIKERYSDLLVDESKSSGGIPSKIFFPENTDDLLSIISKSSRLNQPLRLIGSHTGTSAGAVPDDNEWVISFSRMNHIESVAINSEGEIILKCEPGVTIDGISEFLSDPGSFLYKIPGQQFLSPGSHFYPPDPTETTAQLGGTVATNASGARSFRFGATRCSIYALSIITPNAETFTLTRGITVNPHKGFEIITNQGSKVVIPPFSYQSPQTKNAAGYYSRAPMDPIDLFIGSEGTLGIFSSITIKLKKAFGIIAGCTFFKSLENAFLFTDFLRRENGVISIEFFDESALKFIDGYRNRMAEPIPDFPDSCTHAILWEFAESEPGSFQNKFESWESFLNSCDSSFDNTWSGMEPAEIERLKRFRHTLPESINSTVSSFKNNCPSIRKIGTDTALPAHCFASVYQEYLSLIKENNLHYAAFGHLGDYHIHINLLPSNEDELKTALDVYDSMMELTVKNGGTISAEHGIGKLKCKYLEKMYGKAAIDEMKTIKRAIDPQWRLNRGTIF